jgi:CubicO group peptidase (beta-lactamase class C family)
MSREAIEVGAFTWSRVQRLPDDVSLVAGTQLRIWLIGIIAFASIFVTLEPAHADAELQSFLEKALPWVRNRDHLPAMAALVMIDGQLAAEGADGVRALGHSERVTVDDSWHIGSDTKAFTATLIARLVERGVLSFDDTLAASFPAFAKSMNPVYRGVTLKQLLSHTSGLPSLATPEELPPFLDAIKSVHGLRAQRTAIARHYLTNPPASKPGEFRYSNIGYVIAGAIAEARTGKNWETLLRQEVFVPLGIVNARFGAPGASGKYDQPLGHHDVNGQLTPVDPSDPESDNPSPLAPGGGINITLKDWALFAQDQLDGAQSQGKLLRPATYRLLQTPVINGYALGWLVDSAPDGSPRALKHNGTNTLWFSEVHIYPKQKIILLVVTNAFNDAAQRAVHDLGIGVIDHVATDLKDVF